MKANIGIFQTVKTGAHTVGSASAYSYPLADGFYGDL
jgi:hypothetical protein